jgi:hypothetical protein
MCPLASTIETLDGNVEGFYPFVEILELYKVENSITKESYFLFEI